MTTQVAPEKPLKGQPCNGCGLCCAVEVCALGKAALGPKVQAPCPGMEWEGDRFTCLLVNVADSMGPAESGMIRFRLGIGFGCDADDDLPSEGS